MNGILAIGASGMRAAMAGLHGSAGRIARAAAAPEVDLEVEAVQQIQASHQFIAHAKLVKTADDMLGTLVDTFA
ncbi:MAG TPA: flagellar basal body rod C-terminal domain-containing protein [Rubrivivax sp.]|nr:hypothetical protein [Burkholderiales bacterium]HNT38772.1 flagellar basal body rod C-terminal domain-containing protein [Rubrivivax sp.]